MHVAADAGKQETDAVHASIQRTKQTLFTHREQRPRPGRDDKTLTSWNALMIKGMAQSARVLNDDDHYHSAAHALDFIRTTMWRDGQLAATYKDGEARLDAYLDDYAFLLDAIFSMLQYRWRDDDLVFAQHLADAILERFEDADNGGYYFTAHDHEQLLQRPRMLHDEATPSGYGIAALALARFGLLCGNEAYLTSCDRALAQATPTLAQAPNGCTTLLQTLAERHEPPEIVIIRAQGEALASWQQAAMQHYSPLRFCFAIPADAAALPSALRDKQLRGEATAYLCRGTSCLAPIDDFNEFEKALAQNTSTNNTQ